jgi:hypothetical protein
MNASSHHAELERLLNGSVDGELSDVDEAALQTLLRDDPGARRRYLQFMQLHADLHWDHGASAALMIGPENRSTMDARRSGPHAAKRVDGWMMLAIAVGTLAAGWLLPLAYFVAGNHGNKVAPTAPTIARVETTQGTVSFRSDRGELLMLNGRGQALSAGTLVLEGESSVAQWRFLDGTLITVSGDSEISFSDDVEKLLRVRQGTLTAEVEPQPAGAPLIVETPTARVDVLGTVFTLAAEPDKTRINVTEGRVRLKRLVDGETIEVSGERSCVASLDSRGKLRPEVPDKPAIGWLHRFTEPPPERWKGEWLPAEGELPPRVRAVACLVGRKHEADYTPIVHYGITARRVDEMDLGSLPLNGVLRIRFRTEQPARLHIMLGLHRADGGFGGNFEAELPRDAGTIQVDGWRELTVPLADFRPIVPRWRNIPTDARPNLILITTYLEDAGLEVSELAIEDAEASGVR